MNADDLCDKISDVINRLENQELTDFDRLILSDRLETMLKELEELEHDTGRRARVSGVATG